MNCPKCGHEMLLAPGGLKTLWTEYECPNCGHSCEFGPDWWDDEAKDEPLNVVSDKVSVSEGNMDEQQTFLIELEEMIHWIGGMIGDVPALTTLQKAMPICQIIFLVKSGAITDSQAILKILELQKAQANNS